MEVNFGRKIEYSANQPPKAYAEKASDQPHYPGFDEEKLLDVAVRGTERFEDANFAPAFKDGHDQRINDTEGGDCKGEAAEDQEQKVQHAEKCEKAFGNIKKRKSAEAEILEFLLSLFHHRRFSYANSEARVSGLVARRIAKDVAKIINLRRAQGFRDRERNQQAAAAKSAEAGSGLGFDDADDLKMLLFWDDGKSAGISGRIARLCADRLAFRVTQNQIFANQRRNLRGQLF